MRLPHLLCATALAVIGAMGPAAAQSPSFDMGRQASDVPARTSPTQQQGLDALVNEPDDASGAGTYRRGGYINSVPLDPWGRPFIYKRPGEKSGRAYDLYSLGADGQEGGEDENADIGNWN